MGEKAGERDRGDRFTANKRNNVHLKDLHLMPFCQQHHSLEQMLHLGLKSLKKH